MTEIHIRKAYSEDAALIAAISRETFYDSFAEQNTAEDMQMFMEQSFNTERLMAEVLDPNCIFFLAFNQDEVAGYVKLQPGSHPHQLNATNAIEISRFYARKSMIGKGVGKTMMLHVINYAEQTQHQTIWLGVWEHNKRAIAFYQSFGFRQFSEHDFILGKDIQRDWLMKKGIGE